MKRIYVAGKMRNVKDFNFPAFDAATKRLEEKGYEVFNPARRDRQMHGNDVGKSATGDLRDAEAKGFSLRDALAEDTSWICLHADAIYLLNGWYDSKGAKAELALALALGLEVIFEDDEESETWGS